LLAFHNDQCYEERNPWESIQNDTTYAGKLPQRQEHYKFNPHAEYQLLTIVTGQLGRVAVIGGSEDYTGAPYFSAMASAKLGCDMVYRHLLTL